MDKEQNLDNIKLCNNLIEIYGSFMHLKIYVDIEDIDLKNKYIDAINLHYNKLKGDLEHIDAGFDLFTPQTIQLKSHHVNKIDYKIICNARIIKNLEKCQFYNTGYYINPRSSISKNKLRLANNTGIIDAGYRGHLIGMFDLIYSNHDDVIIDKFDRHLQICAPNLIPIFVELVDNIEELDIKTLRGNGGFGSSGRN